ncbi:MAG: hypothetical protein AAF799_11250 [Myxococcota bacterium]
MKRTFATSTFAVALLGVAACKGGGGDAAKFIPEAATVVGGADLAGLQKTKLWTDNLKGMVESNGKEQLAAMGECKLGLDKFKSVTFGVDPNGGDDKMAVVIAADGIGVKANLDCAHDKIKEKEGKEPWTAEEDGKVLKMANGGAVAYVVDDNTLVVSGKDWAEDVKKLTKGEGKSAFDGSLKDVLGKTDTGKHVWFAGKVPEKEGKGAAEQLGAAPASFAGYADLSSGVETKILVGFASGDEAESVKTKVQGMWDGMFKDMAKAQTSEEVINSVKFGTSGEFFTVEAKASDADLAKSMEGLKAFM